MLIDTHCHLASPGFLGETAEIVARARDAGVTRMIAVATGFDDIPRVLELADAHSEVFATVGVHPCDVPEVTAPDWLDRIAEWIRHEKVVAIGETGLDYFHAPPPGMTWDVLKARQAEFFRRQLELAADRGLPVVVHQRGEGCWPDAVALVGEFGPAVRAQFHCYVGTWAEALPVIAAGHLISFTGIATYPKAPEVAGCARQARAGAFMVETDAPYLAPSPHRGRRCEPSMVRATAEFISRSRGQTLETLAADTTRTAETFFRFG